MLNRLQILYNRSGIPSLNPREKYILTGGLIFLICFSILKFIAIPCLNAKKQIEHAISVKNSELLEIKKLRNDYRMLQTQENTIQSRISKRDPQFSLFTFLDNQAEQSDVKRLIKSMKPSVLESDEKSDLAEALVDMKIQDITMKALVQFLQRVESEKSVVFVKRISIQGNKSTSGLLDVNLQLATFTGKM